MKREECHDYEWVNFKECYLSVEQFINEMEDVDNVLHRFNRYFGGVEYSTPAYLDICEEGRVLDEVLLYFVNENECRWFERLVMELDQIVVFEERKYPFPLAVIPI